MATEEPKTIRVQIYHPLIGSQNFQLSSKENFSDLRELLLETTPITIFENFRFELNGQILSEFQELGSTVQNEARINLVLEPFDEKCSIHHFERVREILADPLKWIFLNCNKQSLEEKESFTYSRKPENINIDNFLNEPLTSPLAVDTFQLLKTISIPFFENLAYSNQGNPTPLYKRLAGDFFYINFKSLEGHDHHISANPEGFTVNTGNSNSLTFYNLLDLFKFLSPKFGEIFNSLRKTYYAPTEYEKNLFIPYKNWQHKEWLRSNCTNLVNKKNQSSSQKASLTWSYSGTANLNLDHFSKDSLSIKDWNEIIQLQNSNPQDTEVQIASKEKNKYKIYQDFISFVRETVMKVVEGIIQPCYKFQGGEGIEYGVYQYGSIVFWAAEQDPMSFMNEYQDFDVAEEEMDKQSMRLKKPRISRRTINTEIKNLEHLFNSKKLEVGYRHTVLIRYKGYSIVAQTMIPGLPLTDFFEKSHHQRLSKIEQNRKSLFFDNHFKQTLQGNLCKKYSQKKNLNCGQKNEPKRPNPNKNHNQPPANQGSKEILERLAKFLKLAFLNEYRNEDGDTCSAYIHPKLRTHQGIDHRNYLINLYTLSPRDINFSGIDNSGSVIRKQLLHKYEVDENSPEGIHKNSNSSSFTSNASTITNHLNTMIDAGFRMVFSKKVSEEFLKLSNIKTYAKDKFVTQCLQQFLTSKKKYLADSKSVLKVMHQNGLGSRYLGFLISANSSNNQSPHIKIILEKVILVKTLKSIFQITMRDFENINGANGDIRFIISRLLNCLFVSDSQTLEEMNEEARETNKDKEKEDENSTTTISKKKKKKSQISNNGERRVQERKSEWDNAQNVLIKKRPVSEDRRYWSNWTINPIDLEILIVKIADYRYNYKFPNNFRLRQFMREGGIFRKTSILRDLCLSLGIVLERVEYFERDNGYIFKPDNVVEMKPIVKSININIQTLNELVERGDTFFDNKKIQEAVEAYHVAINYITTNFGLLNQKLAELKKKIADIYFKVGEIDAAIAFLDCSIKIYERICGVSDVKTLECYGLLSQFFFFKRNFEQSQFYMLKTIHLATISFGEEYPELIGAYLNLSSIYEGCFRFMDSITSATKALEISEKIYGKSHINTATCYSALSASYFEIPDINKAILFQKNSIEIMKSLKITSQDSRMKEALKILQFYQSLLNSKKVKQNHDKEKKKLMNNQIYSGFQFMGNPRDQNWKMGGNIPHYMLGPPNKGFMF